MSRYFLLHFTLGGKKRRQTAQAVGILDRFCSQACRKAAKSSSDTNVVKPLQVTAFQGRVYQLTTQIPTGK